MQSLLGRLPGAWCPHRSALLRALDARVRRDPRAERALIVDRGEGQGPTELVQCLTRAGRREIVLGWRGRSHRAPAPGRICANRMQHMEATVAEIAPDVFRISIYPPG